MNLRSCITITILAALCGFQALGQTNDVAKPKPLGVLEIVQSLEIKGPVFGSKDTYADVSRKAIQLVRTRCDIDFIDDGTNYWVLRTAGATEELLREIDLCRTQERKKVLTEELRTADAAKIHNQKKVLLQELIRVLFRNKDIAGRKRTIEACEEYVRRYDGDRFGDPGADEMLKWIKDMLPRMKAMVSNMQEVT